MEEYISTGDTANVHTERLLNFLLVSLDTEKDYMKFCVVINSISIMTNLPYRMVAGMYMRIQIYYNSFIISLCINAIVFFV